MIERPITLKGTQFKGNSLSSLVLLLSHMDYNMKSLLMPIVKNSKISNPVQNSWQESTTLSTAKSMEVLTLEEVFSFLFL